jgi:hypothetical protein
MATGITIVCRFSDGTYGYLQNTDVTAGATGEEILTSNASSALNQTADVSVGQAFNGKVCTHAVAKVATQNAATGTLIWAAFKDAQGRVIVPIEGGGSTVQQLPQLYKPVRLQTGVTASAGWQATADSSTLIASLVVCTPQACDYFSATMVDVTSTELVNASGSSIGQSLAGFTSAKYWGTYPSTIGMNNQLGGVSTLWVESAEGQVKGLIPPGDGAGSAAGSFINSIDGVPITFNQNDKAYGNTDT